MTGNQGGRPMTTDHRARADSGPRLFVAPDEEGDQAIWRGTDLDSAELILWRKTRTSADDTFDALAALVEADQAGRVAGPGQVVVDRGLIARAADYVDMRLQGSPRLAADLRAALDRAEGDR